MKDFKNSKFVIFDVETTGLSPRYGDRVVEVAALKVLDLKIVDRFESFVDPEREISPGAFEVNGITKEMLSGAPKAGEVLPEFLEFLNDAYLVGHNIKFDLKFLNNELFLADYPPLDDRINIDTIKMAKGLVPAMGRYSLAFVAHSLGVENEQQHRAMSDVELTFEVFCQLLKIAEQKQFCDADLFLHLFGSQKFDPQQNDLKITTLSEAIATQEPLELLYFGIQSGATLRMVTPKKILGEGQDAVLIGFCHLRNEDRNFRVDKIVRLGNLPN